MPASSSEALPSEPDKASCEPALVAATYNIRFDNPEDGPHIWANRKDQVVEQIERLEPDVLGVQEAEDHQLGFIHEHMPGYGVEGVGRDGGREGEFSAILYRKDRFEKLDGGTFWLSPTPQAPRSAKEEKPWNTHLNRIATWLSLRDTESQATWLVVNAHFDHTSEEARVKSAEMLIDFSRKNSLAVDSVVVMGDFNAVTGSLPHRLLGGKEVTEGGLKSILVDARNLAHSKSSLEENTTVTTWTGLAEDKHIDHIFVSPSVEIFEYRVVEERMTYAGQPRFASDHLPVRAELCAAAVNEKMRPAPAAGAGES